MDPHESCRQERIPLSLQAVFLASNRGKDVCKPPPQQAASKTFFSNWLFQKQSSAPLVSKKCKQNRGGNILLGALKPIVNRRNVRSLSPRRRKQDSPNPCPPGSPCLSSSPNQMPSVPVQMSPQGFLDSMLRMRGYSTQKYKVVETAYYNKPTPLQLASYHVKLVEVARASDSQKLKELISVGLSPNPCNQHGESLMHSICRCGDYKSLMVMIGCGASVQVSDDHGRTPLHDACWSASASFAVVDIILQQDPRLFHMMDARGATPLSYVRTEDWSTWAKFIKSRADIYWPARDVSEGVQEPPPLALQGPNTRPLPDPPGALKPDLATMVASGRITPKEVEVLRIDLDDFGSDGDESDLDDSDYDSDDCSDDCTDVDENEVEEGVAQNEQEDESESETVEEETETCSPDDQSVHVECDKILKTSESTEFATEDDEPSLDDEDSESESEFSYDEEEIANLINVIASPGAGKVSWTVAA